MSYVIRDALHADLPAIRDIYNDAVLNTTAIWNEQPVDLGNRQAWFSARQAQGYPIPADRRQRRQRARLRFLWRLAALRGVSPHRRAFGVRAQRPARQRPGTQADECPGRTRQSCGKHVMVAAIESGNDASIRLHERQGFVTTGQMPQVGVKFGRWLDLTFMQLCLNPGALPPVIAKE